MRGEGGGKSLTGIEIRDADVLEKVGVVGVRGGSQRHEGEKSCRQRGSPHHFSRANRKRERKRVDGEAESPIAGF